MCEMGYDSVTGVYIQRKPRIYLMTHLPFEVELKHLPPFLVLKIIAQLLFCFSLVK